MTVKSAVSLVDEHHAFAKAAVGWGESESAARSHPPHHGELRGRRAAARVVH